MLVLGIVSYKIFPARMGGQKYIEAFYRHLSRSAGIVLAVSRDNETKDISFDNAWPFLFSHRKGLFNLIYLPRLVKMIRHHRADVIIIEHSYFGWIGILLRLFTGKPFVIHSHNIETHRFKIAGKTLWQVYGWYERWVHRSADMSFFICEEDKAWAVQNWKLNDTKSTVITYGTDMSRSPDFNDRAIKRNELIQKYSLNPSTTLFLFNGTLDYVPNIDSVKNIIEQLLPLLRKASFSFRIFICGNRLPGALESTLRQYSEIIYTGFVENIDTYFKGADAFIDPSTSGTGIKTKLVDALSNGLTVISTRSGARGIDKNFAGEKLLIVEDENWIGFVNQMKETGKGNTTLTPAGFYDTFNWENIVHRALLSLQQYE